jgi:peroxiredoxin
MMDMRENEVAKMQKIAYKTKAPDFELTDTQDQMIRMQDFRGRVVLLVMLRGFA